MTTEQLEKGADLQDLLGDQDAQIRKLNEVINFMEANSEKYHYHIQALSFGLQDEKSNVNSWHFLPEYFVPMLEGQLTILTAQRAATAAEFDAL